MPTIYDNIDAPLVGGLRKMLKDARAADFCVGYFNLRGWGKIAEDAEKLPNGCRLLIGMATAPRDMVRRAYRPAGEDGGFTQRQAVEAKKKAVAGVAEQLTLGCPASAHERNLIKLKEQLESGKLQVKFHGRYPLHAKLYLVQRQDKVVPLAGFVGSSNLTLAGLEKNGELNIDVLEQDAAEKLQKWFEDRWNDDWSMDIGGDLAEVIGNSWAGGAVAPYLLYLKTVWHLSQEAVTGAEEFPLPREFRGKLLEFQAKGVEHAAAVLDKRRGVIVGDVVGLGKTIVASAVAKTFQEKESDNVLIVCPPRLEDMWKNYMHDYLIAGDILPHSKLARLENLRRYKLLVIDESHNFRNRGSARFGYLRDYIDKNESRVILLTATPYNKAFTDIASQLRLFVNPQEDLGVRPDNMLVNVGAAKFMGDNPNTPPSSLAAFEKSENVDDWRELMRLFMVRRTRAHIKEHYAEYDEEKERHYLLFRNGKRFYFPEREPRRLEFAFDKTGGGDDDYAKLYSREVVDIIGKLSLPRYGLAKYLRGAAPKNEEDARIIKNLTRAGPRLRGFTRSGLFKRLESGGEAFLLSIDRHILRNNIHLAALAADGGALPVGQIGQVETEEDAEELEERGNFPDKGEVSYSRAQKIYKQLQNETPEKFDWLEREYFDAGELSQALRADISLLQKIRAKVPQWRAEKDRKLQALHNLVQNEHGNGREKILIFSQYKDTVDYLHKELGRRGVEALAFVHGGSENAGDIIRRFSPRSNGKKPGKNDLRVLVATDALSEGQNLQDAHIVVNYDLPWALIRLVQRVGRVDRIGQEARTIFCYSALPEEGIERIILLRGRLRGRMKQNEELIGSDERFFEGEEATNEEQLRGLYADKVKWEEKEGETDLISRAYDIWRRVEKNSPGIAKQVRKMPDVVYSAKAAKDAADAGVIAYVRDGLRRDILAHIKDGRIVSQSQARILELLECGPETDKAQAAEDHHELVAAGVAALANNAAQIAGGQLGGKNAVRRRLHNRMEMLLTARRARLLEEETRLLREAQQRVYDRQLTETAQFTFRRLLQDGAGDGEFLRVLGHFWERENLCVSAAADAGDPQIICSMGLVR